MRLARAFQLLLLVSLVLAGCGPLDVFTLRKLHDGVSQTTPLNDGVTQTTPLVMGEVRLASGEPAVGVKVTAYVSTYQVSSTEASTAPAEDWTDASGRFRLKDVPLGVNTVEAVATEESKAIRMNVAVGVGARLNLDPLVLQPTGTITGRVTADGGVNLLGTTVFIPGTQYMAMTAENGSYTIHHVPVGTYEVAAMRQTYATTVVTGVAVQPKTSVQAPEIALRLDAPVLESLSQANGGAGSEIVLRGRNFGASKNTVLTVTFGNVLATRAERLSDTEIRAWVPDGAQSGMVVVRSNGVASNALSFHVIASLRVSPYYVGLYVGDRQPFDVEALDTRGLRVDRPFVSWGLEGPQAGTLDANGNFEGNGEGWSRIRATSGEVSGLAAVGVSRYRLSSLAPAFDHRQIRLRMAAEGPDGQWLLSDWMSDSLYLQDAQGGLTRLAGGVAGAFSPDGTLASEASLHNPAGVAMDADGNVYVAESDAHRIRVIPRQDGTLFGREVRAGRLYTLAGTDTPGYNGDGEATERSLYHPKGLILDRDGSLIWVDSGNRRIRRLTHAGRIVTLVGGGGAAYAGSEMDPHRYGDVIGPTISRDAAGNLYFHNAPSEVGVRLFMLCRQDGMYFGRARQAGMLYALTGLPESGYSGDGIALQTRLMSPGIHLVAPSGELFISERGGRILRRLDAQGVLTTVAGAYLPEVALTVPAVALPAPATAPLLSIVYLRAAADGTMRIGDLGAAWHLAPR